jgi:hypothetical protein
MRRCCAALVLLAFAAIWIATATLGVRDVQNDFERRALSLTSQRLDFDPEMEAEKAFWQGSTATMEWPETPWHYVGPASAPFPCIVAIDASSMAAPMLGSGCRYYFLWFFGYQRLIHVRIIWNS